MMETNQLPGVGVVVGRFQTPRLHAGHKFVLNTANRHARLLIFVGLHRAPGSFRNELDFETRLKMLQESYPDAIILPIQDEKLDEYWSAKLDDVVSTVCPLSQARLYHGRLSFAPHYKGGMKLTDVGEQFPNTATELREKCYEKALNSEEFRAGQFYYSQQIFPRINPCVDIAITREIDGVLHVALGNRAADPDHWRFPGGHVDRTDENMEHTVRREAMEETNVEVADQTYVCSRMIDDWRNTRTNGTMTTLFHCTYGFGKLQGGDDIHEARWFPVATLESVSIVKEHQQLAKDFVEYVMKKAGGR